MKRILFLLILASLSIVIKAQSLYDLQGKTIVIPGRNPSELIYTRTALEKKSFKDDYKSNAVISNKEIHISKVAEHFKGRKNSLIIEFECGADSLLLRFPLVIRGIDFKEIYTDDRYYSNCVNPYYYNQYSRDIKFHYTASSFNIPFFYAQDIKTIKEELLNKTFFSSLCTSEINKHIFVEDSRSCRVLTFTDYYFNEDDILCINYKDEEKNDAFYFKLLAPHIASNYEREDNTLDLVKEYLVPCEPLYEAAKISDTYVNIKNHITKYKGKEIHINSLYLYYSFLKSLSDDKQSSLDYIEEGIYIFKDFKLNAYTLHGEGNYLPYVILQKKNSNDLYYINLDVNTFNKNIMLKEEYDEQVRLKELKDQKKREEEERKYQAELKAEHNKLVRKYGKSNASLIENGKIKLGFSKQMVIDAWGDPDDISTVANTMFVVETWSYGWDFVTFENGRVVQIIN